MALFTIEFIIPVCFYSSYNSEWEGGTQSFFTVQGCIHV